LAVLFPGFAFTQGGYDWYPVKPNRDYNYRFDTAASISHVIRIDSSKTISGQPVYYLNKIVTICDTCKHQNLTNDPVDSTYMLNRQPQFLLHQFRFVSPDIFHFTGKGKSAVLKTHSNIGASWIYDSITNITATTISKGQQSVFGVNDSVVSIALSSSDTLVLSKQFGLLRFSEYAVSKDKFRLEGIKGAVLYGTQLKSFTDFFNFSMGDVFQYEFSDADYNFFPPLFKNGHEKWKITAVNNYPDSVVCQAEQSYYDSTKLGANPPTITSYTQNIKLVFIDSVQHFTNFYPLQEIWANPYFIYPGSTKFIHRLTYQLGANNKAIKGFGENCPNFDLSPGHTGAAEETSFTNVYLNRNNGNTKRIIGREATEGLGITSELYNDYDRIYQRCLTGYIKGSDTSGVIYDLPIGIKELNDPISVKIFPNPASSYFHILKEPGETLEVNITSVEGKSINDFVIEASATRHTVSTEGLAKGVYIISLRSSHTSAFKKIILSE
jgi:hypothetical protein